jgi:hypothetical protein
MPLRLRLQSRCFAWSDGRCFLGEPWAGIIGRSDLFLYERSRSNWNRRDEFDLWSLNDYFLLGFFLSRL